MNKKYTVNLVVALLFVLFASENSFSQNVPAPAAGPNWRMGGNNGTGSTSSVFGTMTGFPQPIFIYTSGVWRAEFTTGSGLGTNYPGASLGDGLRIEDQVTPPFGNLDMWTDNSIGNGTHIGFGQSGLIQGANTRFEVIGDFNGLWFNARRTSSTVASTPRIIFNIDNVNNNNVSTNNEISRFSNNGIPTQLGFMRVGFNPTNVDAPRRLEVFDNANAPQFRITQGQNAVFTDFQTTAAGDLAIFPRNLFSTNPNRFVGIQTATPGNTLEINS